MLTNHEFEYLARNMNPIIRDQIHDVLPYISRDLFTIIYTDWDPAFEDVLNERGLSTGELEYNLCGEEYDMCQHMCPELYDSFKDFIDSFSEVDEEVIDDLEWIL